MRHVRWMGFLLAGCLFALAMVSGAGAQHIGGREYYVYSLDILTGRLQHCTVSFGDSGDNATAVGDTVTAVDDALPASGTLAISVASETFDSADGSYLVSGRFFNGHWQASQSVYSDYYGEKIFTYYSFLIAGMSFGNGFSVGGVMHTTITEVSAAKGTHPHSAVVPFIGVLITISE